MPIRNINDLSPIESRPPPPPPTGDGEPGEPPDEKEGETGDGEGEDEGEDETNSKPGKGKPSKKPPKEKPEEKKGTGQGSHDDEYKDDDDDLGPGDSSSDDDTEDDQDEIEKRIDDMLSKREESSGKEPPSKLEPPKDIKTSSGKNMEKVKEIPNPVFDWRTIISQFVKTTPPPGDPSYLRPDPRSATQTHMGSQLGVAPVKPGILKGEPSKFKLLMVFDSSGSMSEDIEKALAETNNLIQKQFKNINAQIGIIFYSDRAILKAGNLSKDEFWNISNLSELGKSPQPSVTKETLKDILGQKTTGGTIFTSGLASQIGGAAAAGYNVIMFSDKDILWDNNFKNFQSLIAAHRTKIFFIAVDLDTYRSVITKMDVKSKDLPKFGCMK